MRILLTLLFSITTFCAYSQTQVSAVEGTITNTAGLPLEGVTVRLKKTGQETHTNKDGQFNFADLTAGDYVLTINHLGYVNRQVAFKVSASKAVVIPVIKLIPESNALEEVSIFRGKNKFADKASDYVARMPLDNLENPQVYSVITKQILEEQMVVNYQEALRNAPGIITAVYPAGGFAANLRGFLSGVNHRNGMAATSNTKSLDPVNIERLEVIKGPSGTLFGSSAISFGGLINEVTKRPFETARTEVSYSTGSQSLNRLTADINTPLNEDKTALLRINTAFHQEKSFQTYGHRNSVIVAPSLSYKVNDKLSFIIDAELFFADRTQTIFPTFSAGTTFKNLKDQPIDYKFSFGGDDMDSKAFSNQVIVEGKYKITDKLISTTNISYNSNQDRSNQIYVTWLNDDRVIRRISNSGPRTNGNFQFQQNFNLDIEIGSMRHRLLAGVDVFKSTSRQNNYAQFTYDTVSVTSPFSPVTANKIKSRLGTLNPTFNESYQDTYSAYLSDVINVTERFSVMLSLRADRYENKPSVANGVEAVTGNFTQVAFSPKFGAVYQIIKNQLSVFGNYMNGFANVAPLTQPDGNVSIFEPRQANQFETGLKIDAFDQHLNVTASYYNIEVTNATRRLDDGFTVQDGTQKSKGFELEIIANPLNGLNLSTGYGYNDSYYIKSTVALAGKKVQATPSDIVNFWASYKFPGAFFKNIGLGAGGNYVSQSLLSSPLIP
jgi:iron complex outermembrane receptor protein